MGRLVLKKTEWGELSKSWFVDVTRSPSIQFLDHDTPVRRTSLFRLRTLKVGRCCVGRDCSVKVKRASIRRGRPGVQRGMDDSKRGMGKTGGPWFRWASMRGVSRCIGKRGVWTRGRPMVRNGRAVCSSPEAATLPSWMWWKICHLAFPSSRTGYGFVPSRGGLC